MPKKKPAGALGRKATKTAKGGSGIKRGRPAGDTDKAWLKQNLPVCSQPGNGWWDVDKNGEGWIYKFRWPEGDETRALPFPRLSREQFFKLKEMNDYERSMELFERVAGHLEDLIYDPKRRDRARLVASRLGIRLEND
jgi:hypothetical protein